MANTAQTRKRARQNDSKRLHNASLRSTIRTALKKIANAITSGDKKAAKKATTKKKAAKKAVQRVVPKKVEIIPVESPAFIKKELHSENSLNTDVFSVYGADGTLLAAFENEDTALAAILQSGLEPISLH